MKYCVKCKIELPSNYTFCKLCGGSLQAFTAAHSVGICPSCGEEVKSEWRFCKECAHDLHASPVPVVSGNLARIAEAKPSRSGLVLAPSQVEDDEETRVVPRVAAHHCEGCGALIPSGSTSCRFCGPTGGSVQRGLSKRLRIALSALAIVVVSGLAGLPVYYFWFSNGAIEKQLAAAIARNDLFTPEGNSAFDLYNKLKQNGASQETLSGYANRLIPALTTQPLKMLEDFAVPTNREPTLSEWQAADKPMKLASELKPDDDTLAARATYIEGRIAYLSNRKDDALSLWKRASELDKKWALATNAVGVLYNERKEYQTARQFALEAIRRAPEWAVPYNNVGTSYFLEKNYNQAESYYLQAVERAPNWPRPHAWLGDIAMLRKNYHQAVSEYETALNLAVPGTTTLNLNEIKKRLSRRCRPPAARGLGKLSRWNKH